MKESELIRLQVRRTVTLLKSTIARYYDTLYELRRLTLILFDTHQGNELQVEKWLAREGFDVDADGFFLALPLLEQFRAGKAPADAISHSWNPGLRHHPDARSRMYSLRTIGPYLQEIHSRLSGIAWIYYQDVSNTSFQFPYIDQVEAITPDFEWSGYHTFVSVKPSVNPERAIRWTPPTIDYAGEGLILSASIPVYHQERFVGVWSIDIPVRNLYQDVLNEACIADQINFLLNYQGDIIAHPDIPLKIDKEKGSFLQEKVSTLGGDFHRIVPQSLVEQQEGELLLRGERNQELFVYYGVVPEINWIFLVSVPVSCMLDAANRRMRAAFEKIKQGDLDYRLQEQDASGQHELLIEGYNEMVEALRRQRAVRLQAEQAERESAEKYRLLVNNANDAVFIVQGNSIAFANPSFVEMTGYTDQELPVIDFFDILPAAHKNAVIDYHAAILSGDDTELTHTYSLFNTNKQKIWVQVNSALISWEGRPGILNVARDITEQKMLQSQLNHAQKMEAIGTLAGGIAHDFNNILSAIFGYTELARLDLQEGSEPYKYLQQVLQASHRAKDLIVQILSFSRQQEEELEPIQISPIIKESIKLLRASFPATIEIREQIIADQAIIFADATKIQQVFMNLSTNAYHAMRDRGGILEIALDIVDMQDEPMVARLDRNQGKHVRLRVRDTGCGMDKKTLKRIFEPYYTSKKKGEGTGLGLALVHGIVKGFEGVITVDSEVGQGTEFTIYLPQTTVEEDQAALLSEALLQTGNEHILVVDDEHAIVDISKRMLETLGYTVTTRTSSVESLELFRSQPDRFDLVVTDMTMPNLTGLELGQQIQGIRPGLPIVLCTGFSEQITSGRAKRSGILSIVMKPLVRQELSQAVRQALDLSAGSKEQ